MQINYDLKLVSERSALIREASDPINGVRLVGALEDPKALNYLASASPLPVRVLVAIPENPRATPEIARKAWVSALDSSGAEYRPDYRHAVAALGFSRNTDSELLGRYVQKEVSARRSGPPDDTVIVFLTDAAANPKARPETLELLSDVPHFGIRRSVASNVSTPLPVLMKLSDDMDVGVRSCVAANPVIGIAIMKFLTGDVLAVRSALVQNTKAFALAGPQAGTDVLAVLANDENQFVATTAKECGEELALFPAGEKSEAQPSEAGSPPLNDAPYEATARVTNTTQTSFKRKYSTPLKDALDKLSNARHSPKGEEVASALAYAFFVMFHERVLGVTGQERVTEKVQLIELSFPEEAARAKAMFTEPSQAESPALPSLTNGNDADLPALPRGGDAPFMIR